MQIIAFSGFLGRYFTYFWGRGMSKDFGSDPKVEPRLRDTLLGDMGDDSLC